jgi:alkyl sulfatase BDS1-like metallo-beta-lactamase superfamily hydrolase
VGGLTLDAAILRLADYVIREVWRIESGWWDRNITSAHPAPLTDSTQAILDAITDKKAILNAARAHLDAGEVQLDLHVIDLLAMARADTSEVTAAKALKAELAAALADNSPTYMSENYYHAVAAGQPALVGPVFSGQWIVGVLYAACVLAL